MVSVGPFQGRVTLFVHGGTFVSKEKVDISECVIFPNDINDETPEGQHLIATTFKRNKTKYKKGMTVTKPNDLYSAFMDAYENLYTHIEIYCSKELSDIRETVHL